MQECFTLEKLPVYANVMAKSEENAVGATQGTLEIVQCLSCGFVFNVVFEADLVRYGQDYQAEVGLSATYQVYL